VLSILNIDITGSSPIQLQGGLEESAESFQLTANGSDAASFFSDDPHKITDGE